MITAILAIFGTSVWAAPIPAQTPQPRGTLAEPQLVCNRAYEIFPRRGKAYHRVRFAKWVLRADQLDAGTYSTEDKSVIFRVRIAALGTAQDPEFNAQISAQIKNALKPYPWIKDEKAAIYSIFGSIKRGQMLELQVAPATVNTHKDTITHVLMRCLLE